MTAGMAATRPSAVASSASAMSGATAKLRWKFARLRLRSSGRTAFIPMLYSECNIDGLRSPQAGQKGVSP